MLYLLVDISDKIYKSQWGYFMRLDNDEWVFTPIEKQFNQCDLFAVTDILRNLNEQNNEN
jgi:hypothetical protein